MHVTNVIYFPFLDVMCNMLYQWRKCRKFVSVKLSYCVFQTNVALNVIKTQASLRICNHQNAEKCFSEQSYAMKSHEHSCLQRQEWCYFR